MTFIPFFSPPVHPVNSRNRTLLLLGLDIMWLIVNNRITLWDTLDFPMGLLALMAGSASLWIPYEYSRHELDECDDFCLKDALNSVTIAIALTMAGFHLMDY